MKEQRNCKNILTWNKEFGHKMLNPRFMTKTKDHRQVYLQVTHRYITGVSLRESMSLLILQQNRNSLRNGSTSRMYLKQCNTSTVSPSHNFYVSHMTNFYRTFLSSRTLRRVPWLQIWPKISCLYVNDWSIPPYTLLLKILQ